MGMFAACLGDPASSRAPFNRSTEPARCTVDDGNEKCTVGDFAFSYEQGRLVLIRVNRPRQANGTRRAVTIRTAGRRTKCTDFPRGFDDPARRVFAGRSGEVDWEYPGVVAHIANNKDVVGVSVRRRKP